MKTDIAKHKNEITSFCHFLGSRGLANSSSGNLSMKLEDGSLLFTPTNCSFSLLNEEEVSLISERGEHLSGGPPTKEAKIHGVFYKERPEIKAVVHLHPPYATALSCLSDLDPDCAVLPVTPYFLMKMGKIALIPYAKPGSEALLKNVEKVAKKGHGYLMQNHGIIVVAGSLREAVFNAEELEEASRTCMLLLGQKIDLLSAENINEILE